MSTQVILLEKVEKLGELGDVVSVKPGFARNYLLPQQKALRATKANVAHFEAQKKSIQADNDKRKKDAQKLADKVKGITVPLLRAASESGQLYGSVTSRNIAESIAKTSGEAIARNHVEINRNFKTIGLFPVDVVLHPEVRVEVTVNIARTQEEADMQEKTGKALVSSNEDTTQAQTAPADVEADLEGVLSDTALEMEQTKQDAADAEANAEDASQANAEDAPKEDAA